MQRLRDEFFDNESIETLIGQKTEVKLGGHALGSVQLVDIYGNDRRIAQSARVSFGAGTKTIRDDEKLINYMMKHRHTSPFEHVGMTFIIRCPMDVWRQWVRHRTASINEYSTRYSEAIDETFVTGIDAWRLQSGNNKQGSDGMLHEWPEGIALQFSTPGQYLSERERELQSDARKVYEERLRFGVAREQARKDLPLSTFTEAYWTIDLHNCFHFLKLRLDGHAQLEIRTLAQAMADFVKQAFPIAYKAFEDHILNGVSLSEAEVLALRQILTQRGPTAGHDELYAKLGVAVIPDDVV